MTVTELYNELAFLIAEGKGDYKVGYDTGACIVEVAEPLFEEDGWHYINLEQKEQE